VSRLTRAYSAPSATVNQVFMISSARSHVASDTRCCEVGYALRRTDLGRCACWGADAGDVTRIKAARTMGARGVETISAIALVHIQAVPTSSDVGRSRPLPPENAR
jgi:hypothetical protein